MLELLFAALVHLQIPTPAELPWQAGGAERTPARVNALALPTELGAALFTPTALTADGSSARQTACGTMRLDAYSDQTEAPRVFRGLSASDRARCLTQLIDRLPPRGRGYAVPVALALEELAREGLIEDTSVVPTILECIAGASWLEAYICNRIVTELTRHPYANEFFSGQARPRIEDTPANRALVVAAWQEYFGRLERGYPIFDSVLYEGSLRATTAIRESLRQTLIRFAEDQRSDGMSMRTTAEYLNPSSRAFGLIQRHALPLVSSFAIGRNLGLGLPSGDYSIPQNWSETPRLTGIGFVIYRPGLDREVIGTSRARRIEPLPPQAFDFFETFPNLDLAVAFGIVTTNDTLRSAAVTAVRDSLEGLRSLEQTGRR